MKTTLTIIATLLCATLYAQIIDSTISKEKIGAISCTFSKVTMQDTTRYYAGITFPDARYPTLGRYGSLVIVDQSELDTLILNLELAKSKLGGAVTWSIYRADYHLIVLEKSKRIAVYNSDGAYFGLSNSHADKLIAWLKTIKFP